MNQKIKIIIKNPPRLAAGIFIKNVLSLFLLLITFLLVSCADEGIEKAEKKQTTIITAKLQTPITRLYFNGAIQPLKFIKI